MIPPLSRRLVILGAGGHGKVVFETARAAGFEPIAFLDSRFVETAGADGTLMGVPVLPEDAAAVAGLRARIGADSSGTAPPGAIVALGQNALRLRLGAGVEALGLVLTSVVSPDALVSPSCTIGPGTLVMPRAVINACARIGSGAIINTGAIVEHDCEIGDGVHMAPASTACGTVRIGARTMIGAGTTIIPGITIGADVTIGAGAVVVRDMAQGTRATGVPARPRRDPAAEAR